MAAKPVKIAYVADTAELRSSLAKAEAAMEATGNTAKAAGSKVDAAFDSTAESADTVASKGAQAAGALSGLGDLVGGKFGAAMVVGGTAMQGFADAGDLINVVTESNIVRKTRDIAVTTAHKVATVAATGATKAQAAAQRVLNLAMKANPIGLIITAITLLVAGLVLAYKKSDTFRAIVQKAGEIGAKAIGWIVDKVGDLVGWLADKLGPGVSKAKDIAVGAFKLWLAPIKFVIDKIKSVVEWLGDAIDATKRAIGLGKEYRSLMGGVFSDISEGFNEVGEALRNSARGNGAPDVPPNIPRMATGGIVTRPTLALIGEAGPEAVVPLSGPHRAAMGGGNTDYLLGQILGALVGSQEAIGRGIAQESKQAFRRESRADARRRAGGGF